MAKSAYTWEEVTNSPRGKFKVGDREFVDQVFNNKDRRELIAKAPPSSGIPFIVAVLNARKTDPLHKDVDEEWLDAQLGDSGIGRVFKQLLELVELSVTEST